MSEWSIEGKCCPFLSLPYVLLILLFCFVFPRSNDRQEAVVISGKKLARQIREEAQADLEKWVSAGHRRPHLSVILVGDNPASHSYVLNKTRAAAEVGKCVRVRVCGGTQEFSALRDLNSMSLNLWQGSPAKPSSSTQTSARRSCWTWSTNWTRTIVWTACWSSCLCQVKGKWDRWRSRCVCWFTSCLLGMSRLHSSISFFFLVWKPGHVFKHILYIALGVSRMQILHLLLWLLFPLWARGHNLPCGWETMWSQWVQREQMEATHLIADKMYIVIWREPVLYSSTEIKHIQSCSIIEIFEVSQYWALYSKTLETPTNRTSKFCRPEWEF